MNQKSEKNRGKYFVRVLLSSGTRANPLGDEELAVFCQCFAAEPSVEDVNTARLARWVNTHPKYKRNQSNEQYKISKQMDAKTLVFLTDREIQACHLANRIYPSLVRA